MIVIGNTRKNNCDVAKIKPRTLIKSADEQNQLSHIYILIRDLVYLLIY